MGLECLQIARVSGAGRIITVDVRDEACAMSRELGADHALNATQCDVVATIRDLTGGIGADVVFECAGGSAKQGLAGNRTLLQAIDAVRSGGKIIGVSWFGQPLEVNVDTLRERSLRYLFPDVSTPEHLEHTVRLVASGRVDLQPTIRHILAGHRVGPPGLRDHGQQGQVQGDQSGPGENVRNLLRNAQQKD